MSDHSPTTRDVFCEVVVKQQSLHHGLHGLVCLLLQLPAAVRGLRGPDEEEDQAKETHGTNLSKSRGDPEACSEQNNISQTVRFTFILSSSIYQNAFCFLQ
jgi:hypothetical protein